MTQRKVLLQDAGHQVFDELDAADIPGGSGAPADATYLVTASNASLSAEVVVTAAGLALLDDAAASDQRTTLGLGTLATQSGTFSGTSSGTNTGDQTVPALATTAAAIGTSAGGAATTASKGDHVHATGAGTPSTQAFGDAAATGTGPAAAMTDHKHAMPANPDGISWTVVTKASDESVASSTALQDDDELLFTALSGKTYEIDLVIVYASPAGGATPDIKVAMIEDATARGDIVLYGVSTADALWNSTTLTSGGASTFGTAAANRGIWIHGVHTGAGGSLKFQWAQNTSGVNATIVRAGSVLRYRLIV